jgi:hypothetical protein
MGRPFDEQDGALLIIPDDVLLTDGHQLLPEQETVTVEGGVKLIGKVTRVQIEDDFLFLECGHDLHGLALRATDPSASHFILELERPSAPSA